MQCRRKKLMQLMSLGIRFGDEITVEVSGEDEAEACSAVENVFKECL